MSTGFEFNDELKALKAAYTAATADVEKMRGTSAEILELSQWGDAIALVMTTSAAYIAALEKAIIDSAPMMVWGWIHGARFPQPEDDFNSLGSEVE